MQSRRPLRPSIWVHGLSDSSWAPSFFIIVFGLLQMRQNSNEILSNLRVNHQGRFHLGQAVYVDEKKILTKIFFFFIFFCTSWLFVHHEGIMLEFPYYTVAYCILHPRHST